MGYLDDFKNKQLFKGILYLAPIARLNDIVLLHGPIFKWTVSSK
jgi:hypothetical protein